LCEPLQQKLAFQNRRIEGKAILTVKYVYDGRCFGMQINVGKTKFMRISRLPSPIQIMTDQKQPEIVEYNNYFVKLYSMYM
jgi:hypothetical protein